MRNKKLKAADNKGKPNRLPVKISLLALLLLAVFIGETLMYTWCRVQCVQTGYAIADETQRHHELLTRNNSLKIELAHLKSAEIISGIARRRLGLGMPDPKQIIVVP